MANWKKLIVSGSTAHLTSVTASNGSIISGSLVVTGSSLLIGTQTVTGSLFTTGSNTLIGNTKLTGSLSITGSQDITGYIGFRPVAGEPIPTNQTASYIYTSGSTNDLYFTQYGPGHTNTTRLRWLKETFIRVSFMVE